MKQFFKVKTVDEVLKLIRQFQPLEAEIVPLEAGWGRILHEDVKSDENIPDFERSTMDGYAVRARDTFGTSEGMPGLFKVVGEVRMGASPECTIQPGETARIWTGGMIPNGADAVVMIEYARQVDESNVELARPVAPYENVIRRGEDIKQGQTLVSGGLPLRPQDIGLLAAMGNHRIKVAAKPTVAIISTGDEIVPVDSDLQPGQVRDVNTYTLAALLRSYGAEPVFVDLVKDDPELIDSAVRKGLNLAEIVVLSGGSSVGIRDFTVRIFSNLPGAELLVHGVSVSPGKPTIMARHGNRSLWGLPGHAVSAMITCELFLSPLVRRLSGRLETAMPWKKPIRAALARNVPSVHGRQDYVRVKISGDGNHLVAQPIFGKSGLISTMVKADGLICIDLNEEGKEKGTEVDVYLFEQGMLDLLGLVPDNGRPLSWA